MQADARAATEAPETPDPNKGPWKCKIPFASDSYHNRCGYENEASAKSCHRPDVFPPYNNGCGREATKDLFEQPPGPDCIKEMPNPEWLQYLSVVAKNSEFAFVITADGTRVRIDRNGMRSVILPNKNTKIDYLLDGTRIETQEDGTRAHYAADKSWTEFSPDGTIINAFRSDGSRINDAGPTPRALLRPE